MVLSVKLDAYHPIIGLVVFSLAWLQAIGGFLTHMLSTKDQIRTIVAHVHLWAGRILITLGMINGGLGMLFAGDATSGQYIAYGVVAGVMWVLFSGVSVWHEVSRSRERRAVEKDEYKS
jgi:hypothetical protein